MSLIEKLWLMTVATSVSKTPPRGLDATWMVFSCSSHSIAHSHMPLLKLIVCCGKKEVLLRNRMSLCLTNTA